MLAQTKPIAFIIVACAAPAALQAQFDFKIDDRDVQIHSFAQQGFAYSNQNNFLTMNTSQGSFAMTDAAANISASITDKFRVGAQVYGRNIGGLGNYHVQLDWAFGDYKFKAWLGVRAGKVKTTFGLLNDVQDAEFLQTWAILPQSVYPLDLRSYTIAHTGADVHGDIGLHNAGTLSYTAFWGLRENDPYGGTYYGDAGAADPVRSFSGKARGVDVRWHAPVEGLTIGMSWADETEKLVVDYLAVSALLTAHSTPEHLSSGYVDYARGKWHLSSEFRRDYHPITVNFLSTTGETGFLSSTAWFGTVAYRVSKRLEIGTYNSRFYDAPRGPPHLANSHIFDQTVTARFDITRWWNLKVEEHFIDGYGNPYSAHGFYPVDNPQGLKPTTNMFVIRTAFYM